MLGGLPSPSRPRVVSGGLAVSSGAANSDCRPVERGPSPSTEGKETRGQREDTDDEEAVALACHKGSLFSQEERGLSLPLSPVEEESGGDSGSEFKREEVSPSLHREPGERVAPGKEEREEEHGDPSAEVPSSAEHKMPSTVFQSKGGLPGFFAALLGGKEADGAAGPPPRPPEAPVSPFRPQGDGETESHESAVSAGPSASSSSSSLSSSSFSSSSCTALKTRGSSEEEGWETRVEARGVRTRNEAQEGGPQSVSHGLERSEENALEARETQELEETESRQLLRDHGGKMGACVLRDSDEDLCLFRLWGPHVDRCWVQLNPTKAGESPRRFELKNEGNALWGTVLRGVPSRHFRCPLSIPSLGYSGDPYARHTDFFSNTCYVTDASRFPWKHLQSFDPPTWNKLIIYELHPGTFSPASADRTVFETLVDKLDHIRSLNFNAVEFLPVQEFGGEWGYNPRLLLATHGKYGTPDQLRKLVDECHRKGLAVIFDLVLNHGSAKLNSLWNWDGYGKDASGGIYFEGGGESGWGRKFSFHKREVRDMILAAALCFIEEYGADGLRLDSVHSMPWDLLQELTHAVRSKHPSKILIAEVTPENPQICNSAGFDSCWIHSAYYDAIKVTRGQDGNHHLDMLRAMIDVHRGFRMSHQGVNSLLGSHDQAGNKQGGHTDGRAGRYFVDLFGGRNNWHSRAQCRMWYSLQAVCRGLPMMFMGTETHQDKWWNVDEQHKMNWNFVENHDPLAEQMMNLVAAANKLRLSFPSLTDDHAPVRFCHLDYQNRVLGFVRGSLLVVLNCSESQWEGRDYEVQTDCVNRKFKQVFNSQAAEFGGWEASWSSADRNLSSSVHARLPVNLPKWSVTVYERQE
uniref:1,4-alpha-glucan branching enzyme n=1 Tax=Toxoplasma gondii TaxID=5811 RepID=Q5IXJ0_TOXGO|nr:putative 1,4-alpha-glucan branching enzyme 2 [Toxoplasma gondii]